MEDSEDSEVLNNHFHLVDHLQEGLQEGLHQQLLLIPLQFLNNHSQFLVILDEVAVEEHCLEEVVKHR